jgi:DNA-binding transcriptional ArsR family regulator
MVKFSEPELDAVFSALADPTRRAMVARLAADGEASVSELAAPFAMSLPAVTKHLGVLERAGLVAREKRGRVRHCRLLSEPLREASEWTARYGEFWDGRLEALAEHLRARGGGA